MAIPIVILLVIAVFVLGLFLFRKIKISEKVDRVIEDLVSDTSNDSTEKVISNIKKGKEDLKKKKKTNEEKKKKIDKDTEKIDKVIKKGE